MNIKRCLTIIIFMLLTFFVTSPGWSATYYVDNINGNDGNDGLSPENAWKTIGKANNYADRPGYSDGDTIKFKRGCIFSDHTLRNPKQNNITFEDYGPGNKPLIDGDTVTPIHIDTTSISNLTIKNIDISGQDRAINGRNLFIGRSVTGLLIDGVDGNGAGGSNPGNAPGIEGMVAIDINGVEGVITIRNCTLYNFGPDNLPGQVPHDKIGIIINDHTTGVVNVYDNIIHDFGADGITYKDSTAPAYFYNNTLYNFGEQAIELKSGDNVEIYNNTIYCDPGWGCGEGGTGAEVLTLIGSSTEVGDTDTYSNSNNIIRNNTILASEQTLAIFLGRANNWQVYNNEIKGNGGIYLASWTSNNQIHHNIIIDPINMVLDTGHHAGGISEHHHGNFVSQDTKNLIANNVIYNGQGDSLNLIYASASWSIFKNNIAYQGKNDPNAYAFRRDSGGGSTPTVQYNNWYSPVNTHLINWVGTIYSSLQLSDWINEGHPGEIFSDPLFEDTVNGNFQIKENSTVIDNGLDLGFTQDYAGTSIPKGVGVDLGVFEYDSILNPPLNVRVAQDQ